MFLNIYLALAFSINAISLVSTSRKRVRMAISKLILARDGRRSRLVPKKNLVNHVLDTRLFFLIGCVEECRSKESVRERCAFRGTEVNSAPMKLSPVRRPFCERINYQFVSPWKAEKSGYRFRLFAN